MENAKVRIVALPAGEAPQRVREQWIGLELPLVSKPGLYRGVGVASSPTFFGRLWREMSGKGKMIDGYVVDARRAVEILEASHPEAAAWWRQNTRQFLAQRRRFIFDKESCEVVR